MNTKPGPAHFLHTALQNLPFEPNRGQLQCLEMLSDFVIAGGDRSLFILKGYAGTGKTSLVSAITRALPGVRQRSVLMAPTGRAAKVLSAYAKMPAQTIHRKIFKTATSPDGGLFMSLAENLHRNTVFIVDEAAMMGADMGCESLFNNLLENLFEYVYSGDNCKLLLIGDTAQLPPVGSSISPALDQAYLKNAFYLNITQCELTEVARQRLESGILLNATRIREGISSEVFELPRLKPHSDLQNLTGEELEDTLQNTIREYGEDNVLIVTRSNKRAGLFNQSYRNRIKLFEEDLCAGDKIMIVKNNYYWLPENNSETTFIANGDMAEIMRIRRRETLYGFNFCDCVIRLTDYPALPEQEVKIMTDTLFSDSPALSPADQQRLHEMIMEDVAGEPSRALRAAYLKKSPYYNALQVKFSYAITCHKAQGGQWPAVFIDQGFLPPDGVNRELARWLYTALTRATEKVYLINFSPQLVE
mgnify:CR=1 FL=1